MNLCSDFTRMLSLEVGGGFIGIAIDFSLVFGSTFHRLQGMSGEPLMVLFSLK